MEFKIKIVSQLNSVFALLLYVIIFYFANLIIPVSIKYSYTMFLAISAAILFYILFQKLATAKVQWSVDVDAIKIQWLKQFAFNKKTTMTIKWNEIEAINDFIDPMYHTLKIKLASGKTIKFYHSNIQFRDNYSELVETLINISARLGSR